MRYTIIYTKLPTAICTLLCIFPLSSCQGITKAVLDHEINQLSPDCQTKYRSCFTSTPATEALMDQSKFCQALTSVHACVVGNSTFDICAYKGVKGVACLTGEEAAMADVAMKLPKDCYSRLGNCTSRAAERTLEKEHKYCRFITYTDQGFSVHDCVLDGGKCSQGNYDDVRQAVCGGGAQAQATGGIVSLFAVIATYLFAVRALSL